MNTAQNQRSQRIMILALGAAAVAWIIYVHFRAAVLPYDDAFILYRYIDYFSQGKGLIYNAGEHAWGYSAVTYVFWLSMWHHLAPHIPLPELAVRTNALPFAAAGIAVFLLVRHYTGRIALAIVTAGLVVLNPALLAISTGGMESYLFLALLLFSLLAAALGKPVLAGLLGGLALLTRLEGIIVAPILVLYFFRDRKALLRMSVAMLSLPLIWLAFAWRYYGTLIPHSVLAKSRPIYVLPRLYTSYRILMHLGRALLVPGIPLLLFCLGLSTVACFFHPKLRAKSAWAVPLFFWGLFCMYSVGNPLLFEWYWPWFLVPAIMTIALGASALADRIAASATSHPKFASTAVTGLWSIWMLGAAISVAVLPLEQYSPNWPISRIGSETGRLRCKTYREAAEWLNSRRKPEETVLAPEIGALGYYLEGNLIDACGLVSPKAIRYLPVPANERISGDIGPIPLALVRDMQPDFIVTMPVFAEKNVLDDPWARATYQVVTEFRLPMKAYHESDRVLILKRGP
jgi:hypothetical protein